jgi:hypothetical protein
MFLKKKKNVEVMCLCLVGVVIRDVIFFFLKQVNFFKKQ